MQEKMTAFESKAKKIAPSYHVGMGRSMSMGMGMGEGFGMGMGRGAGGGTAPKAAPVAPPPNNQAAKKPHELKGRNGPSAIPGLHTRSAAKGDEMGLDRAHHYHYFAGGGPPYLAT